MKTQNSSLALRAVAALAAGLPLAATAPARAGLLVGANSEKYSGAAGESALVSDMASNVSNLYFSYLFGSSGLGPDTAATVKTTTLSGGDGNLATNASAPGFFGSSSSGVAVLPPPVFSASPMPIIAAAPGVGGYASAVVQPRIETAVVPAVNRASAPRNHLVPEGSATSALLLAGLTLVAFLRKRFC